MITVDEFLRCNHVVNHVYLCRRDKIKRYQRYRRARNRRKYMGKKRYNENGEPYSKKQKTKKNKKGDSVHQRLVAVGGVGTRYREKKNIDVTPTITFTLGASTFVTPILLNGVAVGDDGVSRDGRKVLFKKILVRALYRASTAGAGLMRFIVFYDKQANGAVPAITDVLTEDHFLSTNNLGNVERFVILKDWITRAYTADGPEAGADVHSISTQMETLYSGTTSAITSISSGAIYIMAAGAGTDVTGTQTVTMRIRSRFVDV